MIYNSKFMSERYDYMSYAIEYGKKHVTNNIFIGGGGDSPNESELYTEIKMLIDHINMIILSI